jgi:hypothetical protein
MTDVPDKSSRENQNTHFMFDNFFLPPKIMEKYGRTRQATDDNIMLRRKDVICMLGN